MEFAMSSSLSWESLAVAFVAGIGLGLIFFGGLWWTVNRLQQTRLPGLLFASSFVVRSAIVLAGIYFVADGQWQQVASCVVGIIVVRVVLTRRWGPPADTKTVTV